MNNESATKADCPKNTDAAKLLVDKDYTDILSEYDPIADQKLKRIQLIKGIESENAKGRKIAVIAFIANLAQNHSEINANDIPTFGDALMHIGHVDTLRLIINSPGGDGNSAEKIIEMCRNYCSTFEVIIPNMAKSAATMIALGADSIVMGYCSELGPIDAQIIVLNSGVPHYISAQSFINTKKKLIAQYNEIVAAGKDPKPVLQLLASIDNPFVEHCEKLMQFCKDMAEKNLKKHMFKKYKKKPLELSAKIDKVLLELASTDTLSVHGRMISAHYAKVNLGLNIISLAKDDSYWKNIWEYYVRTHILLSKGKAAKILETRTSCLIQS